jgi:plastocyanin
MTPLPAAGSGTAITGTVRLEGAAPPGHALDMAADPYCKTQHAAAPMAEGLVTNPDGTLRNVFVYVKEGLPDGVRYAPPAEPVVLDQVGCQYRPHVFGIMVGQELTIVNSDGTLHNVHSLAQTNRAFNVGLPDQGMKVRKSFTSEEIMVRIKCDVHPWMECWAGVLTHPFFAVSGDGGAFTISDLPPGSYVIEAWHEQLGVKTQSVTVTAGVPVELGFTFQVTS